MNVHTRLIDPNFQSQHSGKCDLHIHISRAAIRYAIIDIGKDQLKALVAAGLADGDDRLSSIEAFLTENKLAGYHFRKVKISVETPKFTFIPIELYNEQDSSRYLKYINPLQESDVLQTDIKRLKLKNIIAIDSTLQYLMNSHFRQPQLFSQADPFIAGARMLYANRTETVLYINISKPTFEATVIREGKLLFYNLFDCSTPDEFNYFLLLMMERLDIDPLYVEINLAGEISSGDELYNRIEKYFSTIMFIDTQKLVAWDSIFSETEPHRYFPLIALNLCE